MTDFGVRDVLAGTLRQLASQIRLSLSLLETEKLAD